jgi:hypothetical protein
VDRMAFGHGSDPDPSQPYSHVSFWRVMNPSRETVRVLKHREFVFGETSMTVFEVLGKRHPGVDRCLMALPEGRDEQVDLAIQVAGKAQPASFEIRAANCRENHADLLCVLIPHTNLPTGRDGVTSSAADEENPFTRCYAFRPRYR